MRYQIKDKHNFFIREDGDSSMVLFKEKHDQFILNGTGLVMFNLILENNQTQKVLEELKKIYENIEIAVLENDLQDIIRMLKMYGILVMEQEIEENVCKHTDISAVDENDYEKVGRFVEENRCSDFFVAGGKGYYTAVNIRAHIMNNQELIAFLNTLDLCQQINISDCENIKWPVKFGRLVLRLFSPLL